jgi:nickel/cobalt exporter
VPTQLAGPGGWARGFGAIFAVGLRPCSGAILVLVFALAQGMFWAGIAATFVMGLGTAITVASIAVIALSAKDLARRMSAGGEGGGALIMRGLEFGAAGLVLFFGIGLLFGYMAAERATCL